MESYGGYSIPKEGDASVPAFQMHALEKIPEELIPPKFLRYFWGIDSSKVPSIFLQSRLGLS
jgi:hypothetical protein